MCQWIKRLVFGVFVTRRTYNSRYLESYQLEEQDIVRSVLQTKWSMVTRPRFANGACGEILCTARNISIFSKRGPSVKFDFESLLLSYVQSDGPLEDASIEEGSSSAMPKCIEMFKAFQSRSIEKSKSVGLYLNAHLNEAL